MGMDHDFPIDQFIAEASTPRWFNSITTAVWISAVVPPRYRRRKRGAGRGVRGRAL
jgi:hypothetical protein